MPFDRYSTLYRNSTLYNPDLHRKTYHKSKPSLEASALLGLDLDEVAVRINNIDELPVDSTQHCFNDFPLLVVNLRPRTVGKAVRLGNLALTGGVFPNPLEDLNAAHLVQPCLQRINVGDDNADVTKSVALLGAGRHVPLGHVQVDELNQALVVVLLPVDLLGGLVPRAVATALALSKVRDGEVLRGLHRENVAHAEDSCVEFDGRGEIVHV